MAEVSLMPDFTGAQYVHLHTHSEYSMLMGALPIPKLIEKVKELGQPALALTDHGNMFGMLEFYTSAKKAGLKPIIGSEIYLAPENRNRLPGPTEKNYTRLILIAETTQGYKNLMKISSLGYLEGYHQKPRIDKSDLRNHAEGLICLTCNLQGEAGQYILGGDTAQGLACVRELIDIFGSNQVFLCLQNHGLHDEEVINQEFKKWNQDYDFPLVAVNDVHYLTREDSKAHDVLLCIESGNQLSDEQRPRFPSDEYYLRSTEEMTKLFADTPGALENTVLIAKRCQAEIEFGKLYWPHCPLPAPFETDDDYLHHLAWKGLAERYPQVSPEMQERLGYELAMMKKMGVAGYMLIVQDFINAARTQGIPVGPGRGSAVGSLVSYCIGVTDVDPLRYNLLFERFLNPERVSMPDIDTDFSDLDRGKVIRYVIDKYGADSVAQIVTYGRMKAKMVLRDVGRVLGFEAQEINRICKLFPAELPFADLKKALEASPPLKKELEATELTKQLLEIAFKLEGFVRQAGMHAAAVIIAPSPVVNFAPLFKQPGSDLVMIQYDKQFSEEIGLLKMDFLGLRNLSVIQDCVEQIRQKAQSNFQLHPLPEKDSKTLELLARGHTVGVFQFESPGMQDYLRKLSPSGIEDLIAMNALYRPGPMEHIPTYIARKNGNEPIHTYHPDLGPILGETYGVIVYQEQVMQIAQKLSGFSLGAADEMRRAMAKKKEKEMDKIRPKFIGGAKERGYAEDLVKEIWDILVPFSNYAFNKSHSAAYATIAYQTAYLKAHFPAYFLAANMNSEIDNTDRLVILLSDCHQMGITVLGPDINSSEGRFFCPDGSTIRYGLAGIKNVGLSAALRLIEERKKNGPYSDLFALCLRQPGSDLNRRTLESLVYAGALDSLKGNRAEQFAAVETGLMYAAKAAREKELGQTSLFGGEESPSEALAPSLPQVDPWPYNEMLRKEKEVLGLYLSGHPLEPYRLELEAFSTRTLAAEALQEMKHESEVVLGGSLSSLRTRVSQRDKRMFAFGVIEDFVGKIEVTFWSDVYEKEAEHLEPDAMLLIRGKIKKEGDNQETTKLVADKVLLLGEAREKLTRSVHIYLRSSGLQTQLLEQLEKLFHKHEGRCQVHFHIQGQNSTEAWICSEKIFVAPDNSFIKKVQNLLGRESIKLSNKWHGT